MQGITTQIGKKTEVLSELLDGNVKNAGNVNITKLNVDLNPDTKYAIETLEILQNYRKIEDLNKVRFVQYMEHYCKEYSDNAMNNVLQSRKYKKSTIAFLKAFLDHFNTLNTLEKHLSALSTYTYPSMEELYEAAS